MRALLKIHGFSFLCLMFFLPFILSGQTEDVYDMSLEELLHVQVTSASKMEQDLANAPSHLIVITREQIRDRGYQSLEDILRDLPAIDIQEYSHVFSFNRITMRGISGNNKFLILLNGQRISSPTTDIIPVKENYPIYFAKQVEIILGPGSAIYGADAFSGLINIITDNEDVEDEFVVGSSYGTASYSNSFVMFHKQIGEQQDIRFGAQYHQSDNPDLSKIYKNEFTFGPLVTFGGDTAVTTAQRKPYSVPTSSHSVYLNVNFSEDIHFSLFNSYYSSPTAAGIKPNQNRFGNDLKYDTDIFGLYGEISQDMSEKLHLRALLSFSTYNVLPKSKFNNIYSDYKDAYKYATGSRLSVEQQVVYDIYQNHNLSGGLSYEVIHALPQTMDLPHPVNPDLPLSEQNYYYPGTDNTLPIKFFYLDYTNLAGYLQWEARWCDKFGSTVGIRYDANSRYSSTLMPRIGFIFKPASSTNVKLLYGESYLAPSPYTSYDHFGSFSGQKNDKGQYISYYLHIPNSKLNPERSKTVELELERLFFNRFQLTGSFFDTFLSDLILRDAYSEPSYYIRGGEILNWTQYKNLGKGQIWGGSVFCEYLTTLPDSKLQIWANYTYTNGYLMERENGDKKELPFVAKHKFKAGLSYRPFKNLVVSPTIYWIGETNSVWEDENDPQKRKKVDGYQLVNLHLAYERIFDHFTFALDITNLLNKKYYNAGGTTSTAFVSAPQDPFQIRGGLIYNFWQ